jgi:urease accessory protein
MRAHDGDRRVRRTAPDMSSRLLEGAVRQRRAGGLAFAIGLAVAFGVAGVTPAYGHGGTGLPGGFESGFRHPFTGWDHLLAMVSVGIWGAFLGRPLIYALPVIFPAMMVGGAILGMFSVPMPSVELGIAASVLVLGLCVCLAIEAPVWAACTIVAIFAAFHGYAHGVELPSAADPVGYSVGFVLATGLLHVCGISVGLLNARPIGVIVTRSVGAAIALAGGWYLWLALGL